MILARLIRQGMKIRYLCFGLGAIALQLDWFVEGRSFVSMSSVIVGSESGGNVS
jgi:hypothetical protein